MEISGAESVQRTVPEPKKIIPLKLLGHNSDQYFHSKGTSARRQGVKVPRVENRRIGASETTRVVSGTGSGFCGTGSELWLLV